MVCTMARERASSFNVAKGKSKNAVLFAIYAVAFKNWMNDDTPTIIQTSTITKRINTIPVKRDWGL